jgi:hypothetical protein
MPKIPTHLYADSVTEALHAHAGTAHLRVRAHGSVLTVESGPADDAFAHARLRHKGPTLWALEMPARGGRWQRTGVEGTWEGLVQTLVQEFGWTLTPVHAEPGAN